MFRYRVLHLARLALLVAGCAAWALPSPAQSVAGCSLGKVKERLPAQYPIALSGRVVEGMVTVLAAFAPDGHVTSSKAVSGPQTLQFEARAYVQGWRADADSGQRQCAIVLDYRFDGSQGVCSKNTQVSVRPERLDDTHVWMHLSCDTW